MQSFYLVGSASYPTGVGLLLTTLGPGQISTEMERKEKKERKKTFHGVNGAENCLNEFRNTSIFSLQIFPSLRSIVALGTDGDVKVAFYVTLTLNTVTALCKNVRGTKEQRVAVCGILQKRNDLKLLCCSPKWIWTQLDPRRHQGGGMRRNCLRMDW